MPAPDRILKLIEQFAARADDYRAAHYNETLVREEFIDPLFEELGWDVKNERRLAFDRRDVILEDQVKVGGATKAPDYGFYLDGQRKFFVEAKRPSVVLKSDAKPKFDPAFQLRRYAWNARLPLSILTTFAEFAVYDGRVIPNPQDRALVARIAHYDYTQYAEQWDAIAALFSREAVLGGSLDRYAETKSTLKNLIPVDDAFLNEIEGWRALLAANIARMNDGLTPGPLNYAVQMTIDRIVFLRICEDRGIEPPGRLLGTINGGGIYGRLRQQFREADARYNSGLFHFGADSDRAELPDTFTASLHIDDEPLEKIITRLCRDSIYDFSQIPVEVLGHVYERFLGKVVEFKGARQVDVIDKPEVRKAGGVYYTPTYIVDYIVKHTIGALLDGKTPKDAASLRIVDPACGSGSFLLGAYQFLLDWHRDWYVADGADKHTDVLSEGRGGLFRLTTAERKRILLGSVFGVDIDAQAVEVTKLSLLLRVLEGESEQSVSRQLALYKQRALPDLADNIKCGNSLIGYDAPPGTTDNPFDWQAEFPQVFKHGGFDAVIGNPPYFNIDETWGKGDIRQRYISEAYKHIYNDKTDILFYFFAKALEISRGEVSFIVSRAFLEAYKADKLRAYISEQAEVREIIDFRNYHVFKGVGVTTAIIHLSKTKQNESAAVIQLRVKQLTNTNSLESSLSNPDIFNFMPVSQAQFGKDSWVYAAAFIEKLIKKIDNNGKALGDILVVGQGMQTGRNDVFGKLSFAELVQLGLTAEHYFTRARNSDIQRYMIEDSGEALLYLEEYKTFEDLPQATQRYLTLHEAELKDRAAYKRGNCEWWKYTWPLHKEYMRRTKLYCPYMATSNRFALDDSNQFLGLTDTTVLYNGDQPEDIRYVMALLNSQLLTFRYKYIGKLKSGGILEYFWNGISKLPIHRIDFNKPTEKAAHDHIVDLVTRMLDLQQQRAGTLAPPEQAALDRQIAAVDRQIDQAVYALYGLTPEEIALVEGE